MPGRLFVSSFSIALALGGVGACGKTSAPKGDGPSQIGVDFCKDLAERLASCSLSEAITDAQCRRAVAGYDDSTIESARSCMGEPCVQLLDCFEGKLPALQSSDPGTGGSGTGSGGSTGQACSGTAVKCVDATTVQFCNEAGSLETVLCKTGMEQEGIVSGGCESNAEGDGCTVDGFMDVDCQAGTPAFAVCADLTDKDLLDVYVACFQDLSAARSRVSCYQDYVNGSDLTVDCGAAVAVCYEP